MQQGAASLCRAAMILLAVSWLGLNPAHAVSIGSEVAVEPTISGIGGHADGKEARVTAFDGGFIAVWSDFRRSSAWADVRGVRFDASGVRRGASWRISPSLLPTSRPQVACNVSACLAVWEQDAVNSSGVSDVFAARFDFFGASLDAVPLRLNSTADLNTQPAVAVDGTGWLAAWSADGDIQALRIGANGQPTGPAFSINNGVPYGEETQLIADAFGHVVSWNVYQPSRVFAARLNMSAVAASPFNLGSGFNSRLATGGNTTLALWQAQSGQRFVVKAARLDGSGVLDVPELSVGPSGIGNEASPTAAWDGTHFQLFWQDSNVNLLKSRLDSSGTQGPVTSLSASGGQRPQVAYRGGAGVMLVEDITSTNVGRLLSYPLDGGFSAFTARLPVEDTASSQRYGTVAWTGSGFVAGWNQMTSEFERVTLRRLDMLGAPVGNSAGLDGTGVFSKDVALAVGQGGTVVVWRVNDGTVTSLKAAVLDASLNSIGSPVLLQTDSANGLPSVVETIPGQFLAVWVQSATSDLGTSRLAVDGGLVRLDPVDHTLYPAGFGGRVGVAFAADAGLSLATWTDTQNGGVRAGRISAAGTALDSTPISLLANGAYDTEPTVASDGRDFLVVWSAPTALSSEEVRAARVTASGTVLDVPGMSVGTIGRVNINVRASVTHDGVGYWVAHESVTADGGADIYMRRVWPDGGMGAPLLAASGTEHEESPFLASSTPGKTQLIFQRYVPAQGASRVFTVSVAEVPLGAPCLASPECVQGSCAGGFCSLDAGQDAGAGLDAGPDAGADAGPDAGAGIDAGPAIDGGVARAYTVGCGCGGGMAESNLGLLFLVVGRFLCRRGARSGPVRRST